MIEPWMVLVAVAVLAAAVVVLRGRRTQRAAAVTATAAAAAAVPHDFAGEREDARRLALGDEGRAWEDAGTRRAAAADEAGTRRP